jgi:hypothetical protein
VAVLHTYGVKPKPASLGLDTYLIVGSGRFNSVNIAPKDEKIAKMKTRHKQTAVVLPISIAPPYPIIVDKTV